MPLVDTFGREHNYLRISVTDRCNLRCIYCMGADGVQQIPHRDILTYEEILQVVKAGVELGIRKVRLTGGEPLVRKDLINLVEGISCLAGITDLSMTTNGILLSRYAAALKEAGLKRVNISLDSLDPALFRDITRGGSLQSVLDGIEAALREGLEPVKVNTVLMKGLNHTEVPAFLKLTLDKPVHVRFIEYMPIGDHDHSYRKRFLPLTYISETAQKMGLPLTAAAPLTGAGPAETFTLSGAKGSIGLIHAISDHFCASCNRLRLTAEGSLKACLYWQDEYRVRPALSDPAALQALLREVLHAKPKEHLMSPVRKAGPINPGAMRGMSKTGG
ncbi:MAG: GTP 3',8-cyclase MoaA [Bacillota bacterium]